MWAAFLTSSKLCNKRISYSVSLDRRISGNNSKTGAGRIKQNLVETLHCGWDFSTIVVYNDAVSDTKSLNIVMKRLI